MYDEERLGGLLRVLPPAPEGWLRAAQELPAARRAIDDIVSRVEADAEFRRVVVADLEAAFEREGVEPVPGLVDELRERLDGH
jgi:hypothetical protein